VPDSGDPGRLDDVEPALYLIEDDRCRRLKDSLGDFRRCRSSFFEDPPAGVGVAAGREAVPERRLGVAGGIHDPGPLRVSPVTE
jgi:hypothetical protein